MMQPSKKEGIIVEIVEEIVKSKNLPDNVADNLKKKALTIIALAFAGKNGIEDIATIKKVIEVE